MIKLEQNMKNKTWWVAIISAFIVLFKIWGIDLTDYIGKDWLNTVNSICTMAILLGISVDTTTQNIGGASNETIQETPQDENISTVEPQENTTTNDISPNAQLLLNNTKLQQIQEILNQ